MSRVKKIVFFILAGTVLLTVAGVIFVSGSVDLDALAGIQIEDIDLTVIDDGTYEGSYKAFPISVTVDVTVKENKITKIDLVKHFNGQGQAAEAIPEKVVMEQSLRVDVISGATYSSKVILLAIENALKSAEGK